SINLRKGKFNHPEKAQIYWESVQKSVNKSTNSYDVAIAFAQGIPTFYVLDKIEAKNKLCWVNANMIFVRNNKKFNFNYYKKFNQIITISGGAKDAMLDLYPSLSEKFKIISNIIDYKFISRVTNSFSPTFYSKTF